MAVTDPAATQPVPQTAPATESGPPGGGSGGAPTAVSWWGFLLRVRMLVLAAATVALLLTMRAADDALGRMLAGSVRWSSALSFPWAHAAQNQQDINDTLGAWSKFDSGGVLNAPHVVAETLVKLDVAFMVCYGVLLFLAAQALVAAVLETPPSTQRAQAVGALTAAKWGVLVLVLVDVVEDVCLWLAITTGASPSIGDWAVGPIATLVKTGLTVLVLLPLAVGAWVLARHTPDLRRAVTSARGPVIGVAMLVALFSVGIGAAQVDDVVRAWDGWHALYAVLAAGGLAVVVATAAHQLTTGSGLEHPAPDTGANSNLLTGVVGLALLGLGYGLGTRVPGLVVPGWMLVGLAVLGVTLQIAGAYAGGGAVEEAGDAGSSQTPAAAPDQPEQLDVASIADWGNRLGRVLVATMVVALVGVCARAEAFDTIVVAGPSANGVVVLLAVLGLLVIGALGLTQGGPQASMVDQVRLVGSLLVLAACLAGYLLMLGRDAAVSLSQQVGTVAVVLGGIAVVTGVVALLTWLARQGLGGFTLPPALRLLRLRRFPVVVFVVVWALVWSHVDPDDFHGIRRGQQQAQQAISLDAAWAAYDAATGGPRTKPVVFVAAQGGGIRAAVWTALALECIFGPGTVSGRDDTCTTTGSALTPSQLGTAVTGTPTPIFLASGASGGSVGIAAWTARRADLVAGVDTPAAVEDALGKDFVAADLAGLLTRDLPHSLLGSATEDRAAILERAWEQAWAGTDGTGLNRGLLATWASTHGQAAPWAAPVVAFNGTSVSDGCRFVSSPVDFVQSQSDTPATSASDHPTGHGCQAPPATTTDARDVLPATSELVDYLCPGEDVPLSTAAHLSARFPYVSPTGRIVGPRGTCDQQQQPGLVSNTAVADDADGGYFDNGAAGTVVDTWRALAPRLAAVERANDTACYLPVMIQIDNSYAAPPAADTTTDPHPLEVLAPASALLGEIDSRESYARSTGAAIFGGGRSASGRSVLDANDKQVNSLWFHLVLPGQIGPQPPLGWTLSTASVAGMRAQLAAPVNKDAIAAVRAALSGQLHCS